MQTVIKKGDKEAISCAARIIKEGGIVAFPTETVYGLGADARDESAVKAVFEAKGRPQDNPLICHVSCYEELLQIAYDDTGIAKKLIDAFSPGPLSLVLRKKDVVPDSVSAGLKTVAVRIPDHPVALSLIRESGCPIAAPSANTSGRPSPTNAETVYEDMQGKIPMILDGGACRGGIESTVLDISGEIPVIFRPGLITAEDLLKHLDNVQLFRGRVISAAPAPGMKYRHYAPKCEMVLSEDKDQTLSFYKDAETRGLTPVILAKGQNLSHYEGLRYVEVGYDSVELAHNLFSALRQAEKLGNYIISETVDDYGVGYSVMNRMKKAASK